MTPELAGLLAAADSAKQALIVAIATNETVAKIASDAQARHEASYSVVQDLAAKVVSTKEAIFAALDVEYGVGTTDKAPEPVPEPADTDANVAAPTPVASTPSAPIADEPAPVPEPAPTVDTAPVELPPLPAEAATNVAATT